MVRIVSAMVELVCLHIFLDFLFFKTLNLMQKFVPTLLHACKVRFKALKLRQKSKIDHRTKRVLPNARCLLGVADPKLGSRMDAPIFHFGRELKFY